MSLCRHYESWWLRLRCMARRFEWRAMASSKPQEPAELHQELPLKNDDLPSLMIRAVDTSEPDRS